MKPDNPFIINGYYSEEYFCDRENEVKNLLSNIKNSQNTTIISDRRIGKTGLIYRFFDVIDSENLDYATIYIDIFSSRSLEDFVKLLSEGILRKFKEKHSIGKKFFNLIKSFRPIISYEPLTGEPQIEISYKTETEKQHTLRGILEFLNNQNQTIILAIDEFQQITEYPEKNIEALLRTYIQTLKNIRFIFCGSKTSLMSDIFSNAKRPFFGSTAFLYLNKIEETAYHNFIQSLFEKHKKRIDTEAITFILNWTERHTFYTQFLANKTFAEGAKNTTIHDVKTACEKILKQNEAIYLQYREFLTVAQWNFLIATAKEEQLTQPTAKDFIAKYNIGSAANSQRILQSLIDKDLLLVKPSIENKTYQLYDIFFMRWLQSVY